MQPSPFPFSSTQWADKTHWPEELQVIRSVPWQAPWPGVQGLEVAVWARTAGTETARVARMAKNFMVSGSRREVLFFVEEWFGGGGEI